MVWGEEGMELHESFEPEVMDGRKDSPAPDVSILYLGGYLQYLSISS